jgi:adenine-specific DNA-methyltransferase
MSRRSTQRQTILSDATGPFLLNEYAHSEATLVAVAVALGARGVRGWSLPEERLATTAQQPSRAIVAEVRQRILEGEDPLGEAFCKLRSPAERRSMGATFTPGTIIDAMVDWATELPEPQRVIDPGTGSGRYLVAAGRRMPKAALIGIEIDPVCAVLARANLAVSGFAERAKVILGDYRGVSVPRSAGPTLYIGNPPYVRHHLLDSRWKAWLIDRATQRGHSASQLAGLHVHFFLATAEKASKGDFGAFITAAEWLDVNYGALVRDLFLAELGGRQIDVVKPTIASFPDAATTAAITYFQIGARPKRIKLKCVHSLEGLKSRDGGRVLRRERLQTERRWSHLTRASKKGPNGYIELGEICRVHRGQVTGFNKVWVSGLCSPALPESVLFPTVTKARELFRAGNALEDSSILRRVIDLPVDLDVFDKSERKAIDQFLTTAKSLGADSGYVATNRKAWWSVGLRSPAPILATYMARRPPAFVHNRAQARHLNIAHGIYPRESFGQSVLDNLVSYLRQNVQVTQGRTYAGGLTKFEPREMERLLVPGVELLREGRR